MMGTLQQTAQRLADDSIPVWRKVEECEPPKGEEILIVTDSGEMFLVDWSTNLDTGESAWRIGHFWHGDAETGEYLTPIVSPDKVKYWMPAPEPPKDVL